jgi:hypothetical protein
MQQMPNDDAEHQPQEDQDGQQPLAVHGGYLPSRPVAGAGRERSYRIGFRMEVGASAEDANRADACEQDEES